MEPNQEPDKSFEEELAELKAAQRQVQKRGLVIGVVSLVSAVSAFALMGIFWEELFRPKVDMEKAKEYSFEISNDPVCREMIKNMDARAEGWKAERRSLRDLMKSEKISEIREGREKIAAFIKAYRTERKRLPHIITKEPDTPADLSKFLNNIVLYLRYMDGSLEGRIEDLVRVETEAEAVPGPERTKIEEAEAQRADVYRKSWVAVTENQDHWRVFRQGAIPCGQRKEAVPEIDLTLKPLHKKTANKKTAGKKMADKKKKAPEGSKKGK